MAIKRFLLRWALMVLGWGALAAVWVSLAPTRPWWYWGLFLSAVWGVGIAATSSGQGAGDARPGEAAWTDLVAVSLALPGMAFTVLLLESATPPPVLLPVLGGLFGFGIWWRMHRGV